MELLAARCVTDWMTENTKRPPLKVLLLLLLPLPTRVSLSQHKYYPNRYHPYRTFIHSSDTVIEFCFLSSSCVCVCICGYTNSRFTPPRSHVTHCGSSQIKTRRWRSGTTTTDNEDVHVVAYLLHLLAPPPTTTTTTTVVALSVSVFHCRLPVGIVLQQLQQN